ncbi:heterokaryon incompatibility protein-domain-containing protein [Lasiosphaeria ovina]|uniref:Heterokaryon incompatibility protein-domain-containing protein n=1 Tax=Lasiosphaeria ovina TaxID=92902 RepID=A0AAE0MYF4_9PEZI|nr:heterokaryon incompatibility protein-domain-containing protein [Lasiosphaeria ovina]
MRLLNTRTLDMRDFVSDDDIPKYAILSHTWEGDQEVSFQEWESRGTVDITHRGGFKKIEGFCDLARQDGFEWVWVDTCCIDKKSSAELSEAINAMFRWYQNAAVCYVYLADVARTGSMGRSRWFTRGWTLQELIAPRDVRFYSADWQLRDTKAKSCSVISSITKIDSYILEGGDLETVSVARKMSWMSGRNTSRTEDVAYCLLGIFDINIPLIYGEGKRAFQRLQEAIMLKTHDQSLFAWGKIVVAPSDTVTEAQYSGLESMPWKSRSERQPLLGIFADGPDLFASCGDIEPTHGFSHELRRKHPPALLSGGVMLGLAIISHSMYSATYLDQPALALPTKMEMAVLMCRIWKSDGKLVGLALRQWGEGYYGRTPELVLLNMPSGSKLFEKMVRQRHVMRERSPRLHDGDIIFRRFELNSDNLKFETVAPDLCQPSRMPAWERIIWGGRDILRLSDNAAGHESVAYGFRNERTGDGVAVSFQQLTADPSNPLGQLRVRISEVEFRAPLTEAERMLGNRIIAKDNHNHHPGKSHLVRTPSDSWSIGFESVSCSLRVYVRVERKNIDEAGSGAVDVVDLFITNWAGPNADLAKRAIELRDNDSGTFI